MLWRSGERAVDELVFGLMIPVGIDEGAVDEVTPGPTSTAGTVETELELDQCAPEEGAGIPVLLAVKVAIW